MSSTYEIKLLNKQIIRTILKQNKMNTKADICRSTGLSIGTCGTILNEMVKEQEIKAIETPKMSGGRPAMQYQYNKDYYSILGLYVNNDDNIKEIGYVVSNALKEVVDEGREEVKLINGEVILNKIEQLMKKYKNVKAIAIGIPGIVNLGLIEVCDLFELVGINFKEILEERYSVLVNVENDLNYITYGIYDQLEDKGDLSVIYLPIGKCLGSGSIVNGELVKGNHRVAGELFFLVKSFGINEQQIINLLNQVDLIFISQLIISIIAILNPKNIVLIGESTKKINKVALEEICLEVIPKKYLANIYTNDDLYKCYIHGLVALTEKEMEFRLGVSYG